MKSTLKILYAAPGPTAVAVMRGAFGETWRRVYTAAGVYQPIPSSEQELINKGEVSFKGDVPLQIDSGAHEQSRMAFRHIPPQWETAENLVMTPRGGGWADGKLHERYSAGLPGIRMLTEKRTPQRVIATGCVVQSAHHDTYGDWVSEYLCPIVRALPLDEPLFLPQRLARQSYVRRDLKEWGVEWESIDQPIQIAQAKVLRQQKYFVHFPREDASILHTLWPRSAKPARPGGVVYLSRRGDHSQVAHRTYPSALVETLVEAHGGRTLLTATASKADYEMAAEFGETLIFDHGSAIYNTLGWPVRRIVEIVHDGWWNNAFLMLADAVGIQDITLIRAGLGDAHIRERLEILLDSPIDAHIEPSEKRD